MEQLVRLLKVVLERTEWAELQTSGGSAASVPNRLLTLVQCCDEEQAKRAYWTLDNSVVVQGRVFEAGAALLTVIFVALSAPVVSVSARRWLVELLTEIALAVGHEDEASPAAVERMVRELIESNMPLVYGLLVDGDERVRRAGLEIVSRIERNDPRLPVTMSAMSEDPDEKVQKIVNRHV